MWANDNWQDLFERVWRYRENRKSFVLVTLLLWILCGVSGVRGAEPSAPEKSVVEISTHWSANGAKANGQITLAVVLEIKPPYHINANLTTPPLIPTSIQLVKGPDFVLSSTAIFPKPEELNFGPEGAKEKIKVFSGRTIAYVPFAVGKSARPGSHPLEIGVTY